MRVEQQMPLAGITPDKERRWVHPEWAYLWTFTFPDDVPPEIALKRWSPLADFLVRSGKRCVRVLEQGGKGRRWHIHTVTPERWSVNWLRPVAERYGFGRINVKAIPAAKAAYVAKYLGKGFTGDKVGIRRWACVGFSGTQVRNTRIRKEIEVNTVAPCDGVLDAIQWLIPGCEPFTIQLRAAPENQSVPLVIKKMEFKPNQAKEVLSDLAQGAVVFVGEYRGFTVRSLKLDDKKNSGVKVERHIVAHNVEVNGTARQVEEWLPVGSDPKAVKPAATKGDLVKVLVTQAKQFGGNVSFNGVIKPLTQLV